MVTDERPSRCGVSSENHEHYMLYFCFTYPKAITQAVTQDVISRQ